MPYKLGWFSTGRDDAARTLLRTVLDTIDNEGLDIKIEFVFSNRIRGEDIECDRFFDLVEEHNIELVRISSTRSELALDPQAPWDSEYDSIVMDALSGYEPDLNLLVGYMLIVGPEMCRDYAMINLHPAAPEGPAGCWQEVIWELIGTRAEETGVKIHLVTEILDRGPTITYCTFPMIGGVFDRLWQELDEKLKCMSLENIREDEGEENALFREIRRQGVLREIPLLLLTLKEFAKGKITLNSNSVYIDGKPSEKGDCMNEIIEKYI